MLLTLTAAGGVFSACTAARWYLQRTGRRESAHLGGRVVLTELWNRGGAFSLPISREAALLGAAAALGEALRRSREHPLAGGLLIGGGMSNLWERAREGAVYDYVRFPKAPDPVGLYVYNLADFAVLLGAAGLSLRRRRGRRR